MIVEVMDSTTPAAVANCAARVVMPWRLAICAPSGGLPNSSSVEGRKVMPAFAASCDGSPAWKNKMPLAAMSARMRVMV